MTSMCICWGTSWPGHCGATEVVDALEADALVAGGVAHLAPALVRARLPVEERAVEVGEAAGVVAVEDDGGEAGNRHPWNVRPVADRTGPGCRDFGPASSVVLGGDAREHRRPLLAVGGQAFGRVGTAEAEELEAE